MKLGKQHTNEQDAAMFLDLDVTTLRDWRLRKVGPPYCKFGRSVRYPVIDLQKFAEQAKILPAAA